MRESEESGLKVECRDCGTVLPSCWAQRVDQRCPECGSNSLLISLYFTTEMVFRDLIEGKVKDYSRKSKVTIRKFKQGSEPQRARPGAWACVYRNIDREHNTYDEQIVDEETGRVLHECHERLSDHRGHGSAKRRIGEDAGAPGSPTTVPTRPPIEAMTSRRSR